MFQDIEMLSIDRPFSVGYLRIQSLLLPFLFLTRPRIRGKVCGSVVATMAPFKAIKNPMISDIWHSSKFYW